MKKDFNVLGSRAPRLDAYDKVTGRAVYADDMKRPGMLHGALVQSPHAHARIVGIDTSAAVALPGVEAVLTGADIAYLRAVREGRLSAAARVVQRGRTTGHLECEVRDGEGRPVARVTSICAIFAAG